MRPMQVKIESSLHLRPLRQRLTRRRPEVRAITEQELQLLLPILSTPPKVVDRGRQAVDAFKHNQAYFIIQGTLKRKVLDGNSSSWRIRSAGSGEKGQKMEHTAFSSVV